MSEINHEKDKRKKDQYQKQIVLHYKNLAL